MICALFSTQVNNMTQHAKGSTQGHIVRFVGVNVRSGRWIRR